MDKVDFPTRLDKLDNSITGINTTIQNIFGRFETIEKNLKDDFHFKFSVVQETIEKFKKLSMTFLILVSFLTIVSLIILFIKL